jgi:nicotinate-nucleotide pyrophosphorylase (carboxylating)
MISASLVSHLESQRLDISDLTALIARAFAEDIKEGDDKTTIATIADSQESIAKMRARKAGVLAGVYVAGAVLESVGITDIKYPKSCGDAVTAGDVIIEINGNTRNILRSERIALNFISHLSGIATLTNAWVKEVSGTGAVIRDTRKTTPGLRQLEKFAVRMGGGENHRMNLSDGAIIKDNHIAAAGSITEAINKVRATFPGMPVEVEVDSIEQLKEALQSNPEIVLLDNMSIEMTKAAVELTRETKTLLESSGGLTLANAKSYAETGVDYLAIGALTHSAPILDIGLDF